VSFTYSADRRIAGHLADVIKIECQHESLASHAGRSETSFNASVTSPDHYDVIDIVP
jgi:hypothetical protein